MPFKHITLLRKALFDYKSLRKYTSVRNSTIVTLNHRGKLQGEKLRGEITTKEYLSWKGIPYAKPPVGELRFKAPVAHEGWTGLRDATKHGNVCIQKVPGKPSQVFGDEDCLYLNVYSPSKSSSNEPYPVMVWVHGGAYTFGSGNSDVFNPELLVGEDVIVVTLNYRLGVLGFLSTEDQFAQGNYGLKDIIAACNWIKANIASFGGDPNKITLFGESGGAMMIHNMILSPLGKGLFQKAILQSGTSLSSLSLQENPKERAFELANRLSIKTESSKELLNELMRVDAVLLAQNTPEWIQREIPNGKKPPSFCPSIEPEDALEPRALPEHPLKMILKNEYPKIPMIIGVNSEEGLYAINEWKNNSCLVSILNDHPEHLLPYTWNINPNSDLATEVQKRICQLYFNKEAIRNPQDYARFVSDSQWNYGPYKTARIQVTQQSTPVYFYVFSFSGALNASKIKAKLSDYEGVVHGDDVPYLFPMSRFSPNITKDDPAFIARSKLVRMWTNFAKYESPTQHLDNLVGIEWPKITKDQFQYMDIGDELKVEEDPFGERMKVWWKMDEEINGQ